jgi:hypothetical protein
MAKNLSTSVLAAANNPNNGEMKGIRAVLRRYKPPNTMINNVTGTATTLLTKPIIEKL